MGARVAHMLTGRILDFIEFDGFAIVKVRAPQEVVGRTLGAAGLRTRHGVTIVGVKRPGDDFTYAKADTVVHDRDLLIVAGRPTWSRSSTRSADRHGRSMCPPDKDRSMSINWHAA